MIYFALAYIIGAFVCLLLVLYEIGSAPDHIKPIPLHLVLWMAAMWPLTMPLAAYVSWTEENSGRKKT